MAKTHKLKKSQPPSLHSRAARRETASTPPPTTKTHSSAAEGEQQPWLYHAQNAGISKKKKFKHLTRQQRVRQLRGKENALRNEEKLGRKVEESVKRGRKLRARREEWEVGGDVSGKAVGMDSSDGGDVEDGVDGDADGAGGADGLRTNRTDTRTWAEKMVEVELEEAMDEIEGFALPTMGGEGKEREGADVEIDVENGGETIEHPTETAEGNVDEVT